MLQYLRGRIGPDYDQIRSKSYRVLLVFAALIGVLVSFASWCFLELVHWIQAEVYQHLGLQAMYHPRKQTGIRGARASQALKPHF